MGTLWGNILKIDQTVNPRNRVSITTVALSKDGATHAPAVDAIADTASLPGNLTSTTAQIRQLQSQLMQPGSGDFDAARVAEIRQAISAGSYQINTGKIADGLIDSVRDLLGQQTS